MIEKIIQSFNLTAKEATVYLSALSLGRAKVSEIAKKAGLNRITTYEVLKKLTYKGLSILINYDKVIYFNVIDPEKLLGKVKRQVESAVQLLPQLLAIKNSTHDKPQTTYYEGVEGIKAIYEDTLLCKEKVIYDILDPKKYLNLLGEDFQGSYVKRRVRRNIRIMALGPDDPENEKYINAEELREVRFFDRQAFNVPNEIMIYDNKVCLISFSSSMGVIVENSDIAQSMKAIWQMVWGNAKKSL